MLGFSAAVLRDARLILEVSLMIRDVDLLRDDQWERLKEFVAGGCKGKRDRAPTIAGFSTRCCGWPARAGAGAICRDGSANTRA
jgi:hypothetical protein